MALNSDKIIGATILAALPGIAAMSLVWGIGILQNILLMLVFAALIDLIFLKLKAKPLAQYRKIYPSSALTIFLIAIAVTPYQPLQGGLLTGKYQRGSALPADSRAAESKWLDDPDNEMHTRLDAFMEEAVERGLSPARYAIEWLLTQPGITSVVVGAKRIDQINEVAGL